VRLTRFEWDEANESHIARHGVEASEVEEVFRHDPYVRRGRHDRYLAYGATSNGRHLFVVLVRRGKGVVRVITARDMTTRERKAYRRWRR
jgi:uncharacterized DUF497 family protein